MKTEHIFQLAAVIFGGITAYFIWDGNSDGVFVSAVLAAAAFFLSLRFQIKARNVLRENGADPAETSKND